MTCEMYTHGACDCVGGVCGAFSVVTEAPKARLVKDISENNLVKEPGYEVLEGKKLKEKLEKIAPVVMGCHRFKR